MFPVFYDVRRSGHAAVQARAAPPAGQIPGSRSLLQAASAAASDDFRGTVDVAVSFGAAQGNTVAADELFRALLRDTYSGGIPTDPGSSAKSISEGEIVVSSVDVPAWSGPPGGGAYVVQGRERLASSGGSLTASWGGVDAAASGSLWGPVATPSPATPAAASGANATTNSTAGNSTAPAPSRPLTPEELNAMEIARLMGARPMMSSAAKGRATSTGIESAFLIVAFLAASLCLEG